MQATIEIASQDQALIGFAQELSAAIVTLKRVTETLLGGMMEKNIDLVLANSVAYLDLFGNVVMAWVWLKQGIAASNGLNATPHEADEKFYRGKLQALQYFYRFELPQIDAWAKLLTDFDDTTYEMKPDWF
jgi:butyryl-CoA dehydrogenase